MQLETALSNVNSFAELAPFVRNTKEGITFFGYRYIKVDGYLGKLPIDTLASKVMKIVRHNFDFDEEERALGKEMSISVDRIFKKNDERTKKVNLITRLFCAVGDCYYRNLKDEGYNPRFHWRFEKFFYEYYTKNQYESVFGIKCPSGLAGWGASGCPDRWSAPRNI